jgi:hypothetical protein
VPVRRLFLLVCAVVLVDTAFYAAIAPLLPRYAVLAATCALTLVVVIAAGRSAQRAQPPHGAVPRLR